MLQYRAMKNEKAATPACSKGTNLSLAALKESADPFTSTKQAAMAAHQVTESDFVPRWKSPLIRSPAPVHRVTKSPAGAL